MRRSLFGVDARQQFGECSGHGRRCNGGASGRWPCRLANRRHAGDRRCLAFDRRQRGQLFFGIGALAAVERRFGRQQRLPEGIERVSRLAGLCINMAEVVVRAGVRGTKLKRAQVFIERCFKLRNAGVLLVQPGAKVAVGL